MEDELLAQLVGQDYGMVRHRAGDTVCQCYLLHITSSRFCLSSCMRENGATRQRAAFCTGFFFNCLRDDIYLDFSTGKVRDTKPSTLIID